MKLNEKQEALIENAKAEDVKFINLQFVDLPGNVKSVTLPIEQLKESLEHGTWFDGSSIEGFTRICESDMLLVPDPDTFSIVPWRPKEKAVARIICDVYTPEHKPFEGDPRYILRRALELAKEKGYIYNTGTELEFFLFKSNNGSTTPVPQDTGSYFDFSQDLATDVRRDIVLSLEQMGINVELAHHEVGPGQHEIDFRYSDALTTADNAMTLKSTVKAIASSHELYATFMPKPIFGESGSGMHVHQSIFDLQGKNAFFSPEDRYKLSGIAYSFIAGQLNRIREIMAVLAPTVNSYKRLVSGYEAPVYICWGQTNRSALIRIPRYSKGRDRSVRAELRCPDPSCNPYLAFALMLAAGMEGIKNKETPPESVEEDVYKFDAARISGSSIKTLPKSLEEAIEEMHGSKLVRETLGEYAFEKYLISKKAEWEDYQIQVTPWEHKKYYNIL